MSGLELLLMIVAAVIGFLLYSAVYNAIHARRNRRRYAAAMAEMERILAEERRRRGDESQ